MTDPTPSDALVITQHDGDTIRRVITRDVNEQLYIKMFWGLRLARRAGIMLLAMLYLVVVPLLSKDLGMVIFLIGGALTLAGSRLATRWRFGSPAIMITQTPTRLQVQAEGALYRQVDLSREDIVQVFARRLFPKLNHEKHLSLFAELRDGRTLPIADMIPRALAHQLAADLSPATPPPSPESGQLAITRDGGTTEITIWPQRRQRLIGLAVLLLCVGVGIAAAMTRSYAQLKPLLMAGLLLIMWLADNHDALSTQRLALDAGGWRLTRRLLGLIPTKRAAGAPGTLRLDQEGPALVHGQDAPVSISPTLSWRSLARIDAALRGEALLVDEAPPQLRA